MSRRLGRRALSTVWLGALSLALLLVSAGPATASVSLFVTNTSDSGAGSLRQAILDANALPDANDILFSIPGAGVHTITPTSAPLPEITAPVNIDGTSQPTYAASPLIQIDGSSFMADASGLVAHARVTIQALDITAWPSAGIAVTGKKASFSTIQDNYVGTDPTGTAAAGNDTGIGIGFTTNVVVQRNLVADTFGIAGVFVIGKTKGNVIRANRIGTNAAGTAAIPNAGYGIALIAAGNVVGGPAPADGNLVSGNGIDGVAVVAVPGVKAKGNAIRNNLIGTNAAGTASLGNAGNGLSISGDSTSVVDNIVSGNGGYGIAAASAKKLTLRGNRVGTNSAGTAAIGNGAGGIYLAQVTGAQIANGAGNTIVSGNVGHGIWVEASPKTTITAIVGTDKDGTFAVPNTGDGIHLNGAVGKVTVVDSLVSGNGGDGIDVSSPSNRLLQLGVGLDETGTSAIGNGGAGIRIAAPKNVVGAGTFASGNAGQGIFLAAPGGDTIVNTGVGLGIGGIGVPNAVDGIFVSSSANNVIGGKFLDQSNVIVANGGSGIHVVGAGSTHNRIAGNLIGNLLGTPLGNSLDGIWLDGAPGNVVSGNLIGSNALNGVSVSAGATGNAITNNPIGQNGGLGIDLALDGVTANDPGDGDSGENTLQNYPVISGYSVPTPGKVLITGTFNSTPSSKFVLEFFAGSGCDGSGNGEGETPIGTKPVKTDASGNAAFSATFSTSGVSNVTATATGPGGNTSEFSACVP